MPILAKDVLVVDDDESTRSLLAHALTSFDATCDTAGDGSGAMELASTTRYQVLIINLGMPSLDGRLLIRKLRDEQERRTDRPVVFVLTPARSHEQFPDLADEAQAVIRKPFDVTAVAEIVRGCLHVRRTLPAPHLPPRDREAARESRKRPSK